MAAVRVIIPAYGHAGFITQAVESVLAQTFTDLDLIVVNDGSPDDTERRLAPYAQQGKLTLVAQPRAGTAAARNTGLARAGGEFIAFLDDDDLWPLDKLAWQVERLRRHPGLGMTSGMCDFIDRSGRVTGRSSSVPGDLSVEGLLGGNPIASPGQTLLRRAVLDAVGRFDTSIWGADDWDMYLRILAVSGGELQPRLALHWRRHTSGASADPRRMYQGARRAARKAVAAASRKDRPRLRRAAERGLYICYAWVFRIALRDDLRRGRVREALADTWPLLRMGRGIFSDAELHRAVWRLLSRGVGRFRRLGRPRQPRPERPDSDVFTDRRM